MAGCGVSPADGSLDKWTWIMIVMFTLSLSQFEEKGSVCFTAYLQRSDAEIWFILLLHVTKRWELDINPRLMSETSRI